MIKRLSKMFLILVLAFTTFTSIGFAAGEDDTEVINEKLGFPIVVYGGSLTDTQKEEVKRLLGVTNPDLVDHITVTGDDLKTYLNGNPNSRMFSSAKITLKEQGVGLTVDIITPDNITEVTREMYANALLTAGVEDAVVEVASPVKVTGHSALVGIYKAYDAKGAELDKDRMEVANEELSIATKLAEEVDKEKVSELLTEIKKQIAEQNPVTREEVEKIVEDQLSRLNIELSPEDRQLLIDLFEKMRSLNINFDNVRNQLEDITKDIKDRIDSVMGDSGFWQGVKDFFRDLFQSIANLFK
ncbi:MULTISPECIES: DUF1002 domain-containing protein [Sutcliffiella]|uniref:DUF1002 domain-containing protein n=1 Tax=Sutcliffiella cohnii TaxID=33932 RepID=A0A223KWL9_9BACI|nr:MULTISPECIES: DUF1002 domain-containing protein [Sutcliffiella]AST93842.1 hypothetical protein BC6307_22475 [Sutcliffiella cohnii]MED4015827.1 DUF1002 domain-containing protein [Sutcliffiella cohnii]WBL15032.1 DUF1002 domain-containing protein [Sutcliffiella sp. NC1]